MNIKYIGCCRGNGKVFVKLKITEAGESPKLGIKAYGDHDRPCPASLYKSQNGIKEDYVAVFPDLDISSIGYAITSADRNEEDSRPLTLNLKRAKWESRLNYRMNKELCKEIRDIDTMPQSDESYMVFWQSIPNGETTIVRGELGVPQSIYDDYKPSFLNGVLEPIDIEYFEMGATSIVLEHAGNKKMCKIGYSFNVPNDINHLVITFETPMEKPLKYFACLDRGHINLLNEESSGMFMNAQVDPEYGEWFENQERTSYEQAGQRQAYFEDLPLFSIVVPLYNTPTEFLEELLTSLLEQTYPNWELLLVNASPEDEKLTILASSLPKLDPRIVYIELESNMGISENTKVGINKAKGDFVCFIDHDDVVEPDILYEYAYAINKYADVDVLYCDEDKLMPDGTYTEPFFKPDFSIDHLRNNNYICHMLAIRKTLLDELELYDSSYDGAQDHYLVLHASEKARRIHHVPRVLYHWRMSDNSTASNADSKTYAMNAGMRAVRKHLERSGLDAEVNAGSRPFTYDVTYKVPESHPRVSILIPSMDHTDVLDVCIRSIYEKTHYDNFEIVIIENNSTEESTFEYYDKMTSEHDNLKVVRLENTNGEFNFSKVINFGAANCDGEYLLLLNNDTEVLTENWIELMLGICAREDVGIVGCRLLFMDKTIQHAGVIVNGLCARHIFANLPYGNWGYFALADTPRNLSAVTAACMMTKRSVFDEVGGFDEGIAIAFNDIDYCLKVRDVGKLVVYTPKVELFHYESLSRGDENSDEKRIRFYREYKTINQRWAPYYVCGDPYFNINLSNDEQKSAYYRIEDLS